MSGCGCKSGSSIPQESNEVKNDGSKSSKISNYIIKTIVFLFSLLLSPIILLFIVWVLFKTIVLSEQIDLFPLLLSIGKKLKGKNKSEETEEDSSDESFDSDNYEIVGLNRTLSK